MSIDLKQYKLGDIAISQTGPFGSQLHEEDYVAEGTPIVTVEHLGPIGFTHQNLPFVSESDTNRLKKYTLKEGDIVFSRVGSIDRSVYVKAEEDGWLFSGRCIRVRCNNSVNPRYLSFYFRLTSFKKMMLDLSVGATMPSLNTEIMDNLILYLPSKEHQDVVASLLDDIDSKISNNNAIAAELEGMAKDLYDYWFVQFDFPDENGKPYKSSGGKMVWNEELKREIPEGWEVDRLGKVCDTLLGGTPDTENALYWNGDIPWLNSGEVATSPVLNAEKTITKEGLKNSATSFASAGAVVMSITRYIRPSILGIDACFNQSVIAVIPNEQIHSTYLYLFMLSQVERYMRLRTGAQQPHINKETVDSTLITLPVDSVLNQFYDRVEPLFERQMIAMKEAKELESLRDFLLPMLMNGQVKVKGA